MSENAVGELGDGKSSAFNIGCQNPLEVYIESDQQTRLFIDDFTDFSISNALHASKGNKCIIGKEEAGSFFDSITVVDKRGNTVSYDHITIKDCL